MNTDEVITLTMVANPKADIEWLRPTNHGWNVTALQNNNYLGVSKVTIHNKESLGNYGVKICNRFGCSERNVILIFKGTVHVNY